MGQSTCIHLITCFIFNVLHLTLQQVTTRIVEEVMMNLTLVMAEMRRFLVKISVSKVMTVLWVVTGLGEQHVGDDSVLSSTGLGEQHVGDDSALGSTGNFAHLLVYIISSI